MIAKKIFYIDCDSKTFKGMIKNAYDSDGFLLSIEDQLSKMKKDPEKFGYGAIDAGTALKFSGLFASKILFKYSDIKHINDKHIQDQEISSILSNLNNNIVLSMDYTDKLKSNLYKKSYILESNNSIYLMGLSINIKGNIYINELTTLFGKNNISDNDIKDIITKSINNGNMVYFNKKSNKFLVRFGISIASVLETIATHNIAYVKKKNK